jgi:glutaredoxin
MKKILIAALIICVAYFGYQHFNKVKMGPNDKITMYSLSYCNFCKSLSAELKKAGIEFVEYYVDQDIAKRDELTQKLIKNNIPGGSINMPVVDLGVVILPNRPSISEIKSHLK